MTSPSDVANDSQLFASTFLRILDKDEKLIPFRWNRVQRHFHEHKTGRDLVLKSRQLGISTYEQGDIFHDLVTKTTRAITLSHDDTTTQILRQTVERFWSHCRFNDIQPSRKYANATMTTFPDFDSMHVIGTAGNTEVGRGGSYSRFHGSEVAKWKDAGKLLAGAMQGGRPAVVLESTPNGTQGAFYELCMDGGGIWTLHFYPWWWDASYTLDGGDIFYTDEEQALVTKRSLTAGQIRWRRVKVKELGRLFVQEYPEDPISCFLTSGNSYFGDLSGIFTAPLEPDYQEGHRYTAGLDFGQANDYTALIVIDRTAKQMVDLLRVNHLEWAEIRNRIKGVYNKWRLSGLLAESNSIGGVNIEQMQKDGMRIQPFVTTNQSKADIMSDLNEALHAGGLRLQNEQVLRHELNTFVADQTSSGLWRLAAEGEGHDDTVIALALANQTAGNGWLEYVRLQAEGINP